MDINMLEVLACPICKGRLHWVDNQLVCRFDRLAFPIRDGIPVMLVEDAVSIGTEEESL